MARACSLLVSVTALLLSACTAEQLYKDLQENHRRQCLQLPVWQQSHCLSRNDTSWEDYERERDPESQGLRASFSRPDYWSESEGSGDNSP